MRDEGIKKRFEEIGHAFIVLSGKGGVGKSTISANLAFGLALRGFKVGVLDIDIHGPSIPKLFGISDGNPLIEDEEIIPLEAYGMKVMSVAFLLKDRGAPVIWRGPLKANLIKEFLKNVRWGKLDFLVIDSPPGTGDEPLTVAQHIGEKASAIIVTTPQEVAIIDVEKCVVFCQKVNLPIEGIIENMSGFVCPKCGEVTYIFSKDGGRRLAERFSVPFLGSIPLDPLLVKSGEEETPFLSHWKDTETGKRMEEIIDQLLRRRSA
jgi:Mrp family chromosome partitioning ATPase